MAPYYERYGPKVPVSTLLRYDGKEMKHLPKPSKGCLCWNYLLGVCGHSASGRKCRFAEGHVAGDQLEARVVEGACKVIRPAVTEALKQPATKKKKTGG